MGNFLVGNQLSDESGAEVGLVVNLLKLAERPLVKYLLKDSDIGNFVLFKQPRLRDYLATQNSNELFRVVAVLQFLAQVAFKGFALVLRNSTKQVTQRDRIVIVNLSLVAQLLNLRLHGWEPSHDLA